MTWIVAPIFVTDVDDTLSQVRVVRQVGADAIELRCDQASPHTMELLFQRLTERQERLIVTVRSAAEGGHFIGSENDRLQLLNLAFRLKPDFVDVELATWNHSARFRKALSRWLAPCGGASENSGPRLIISRHAFTSDPLLDLQQQVADLALVREASILKIAFRAHSIHDALAALKLYAAARRVDPRPLVSIAMDEAGQISRLLAGKFAAAITFAKPPGQTGTAPGQPDISALKNIYRLDRQQAYWKVFAVIGWPIAHSLSPAIHNAGLAALDYPGVYVPLPVAPGLESFAAAVDALRQWPELNLGGLSITIPHKENAYHYVLKQGGKMDDTARRIKAINTIFVHADGSLVGTNSDAAGALGALTDALSITPAQLHQYAVAVLGAGGAARAVVAGLAACGASVVIYNRTLARAADLARAFVSLPGKVTAQPLTDFNRTSCQIIINCTPVGMTPNVDSLPIPPDALLRRDMVVFDTVYNPRQTRLLKLARDQGARTVEGLEMLLRQAMVQFEGFTGQPAPLAAMRQAVYH